MSSAAIDKPEAERRARRAAEEGRFADALTSLWQLCDRAHVVQREFDGYLRSMAHAYERLDRKRAAAAVYLYLGDQARAEALSQGSPLALARAAVARGDRVAAAKHFQSAGLLGHAAIQLETAGQHRPARVLWEQLAADVRLADDPYTQGLVLFNLGRACARLGDAEPARRSVVAAMHALTAAADGFEARGLRERAFDCYGVLITIGKEGSFENLVEGYLNCIRILREDGLKYYVLQYYEDMQSLAMQRGELHAAATLYREAADYAQRIGLPYAAHYRRESAKAHALAADRSLARGAPAEMAENSLAAAIDAYNELGLYSRVRETYARLATLPLSDRRRARYARLEKRLAGVADERAAQSWESLPDYLRMDTAYPEVWRLDVIEWEQAGDPAETMAEIVAGTERYPEYTRRRALLCQLAQLGASGLRPELSAQLASLLGRVELYEVLAPLERLADHAMPAVRVAVMKAARQLFFKRTFVVVMRGLDDPDPAVRREAAAAVATLHFPHALDPLSRIYRDSREPEVRRSALSSIGKIQLITAAELLIDVLRHADRVERDLARDLLVRAESVDVSALVARTAAAETGAIRTELERILRARGAG